jgi:hypothetical protein
MHHDLTPSAFLLITDNVLRFTLMPDPDERSERLADAATSNVEVELPGKNYLAISAMHPGH